MHKATWFVHDWFAPHWGWLGDWWNFFGGWWGGGCGC